MSHIKNIKIIYYLLALCLVSCSQGGKNKSSTKKNLVHAGSKGGDFNAFFKKFKTDTAFQKAHVHFPLKYKISGDEGETDSIRLIASNEWTFTSLFISNGRKLILKRLKTTSTKIDIQVQIEDTGFENEFTFLKHNDSWFLDSVTDNSD